MSKQYYIDLIIETIQDRQAARISSINKRLEQIGSRFRTDDGKLFTMTVSADPEQIVLLTKSYSSIDEAEQAIYKIEHERK